jgi:hypothetical protein
MYLHIKITYKYLFPRVRAGISSRCTLTVLYKNLNKNMTKKGLFFWKKPFFSKNNQAHKQKIYLPPSKCFYILIITFQLLN